MTAKWPSALHAASFVRFTSQSARCRLAVRHGAVVRHYAQQQPQQRFRKPDEATSQAISAHYSEKAALSIVESKAKHDPVNPARSTLPPPLDIPERSQAQSAPIYWFSVGRAYGKFYWKGIKAVWFNYKAAKLLRERIMNELNARSVEEAADKGLITRSEWQLLQRSNHDIGKLPFFGLLVAVFGEWLPLIVPFIPGAVPGTCRIPKQVRGMREKAEQRRGVSFRQGIEEPSVQELPVTVEQLQGKEWPMASAEYARSVLDKLRDDQILHLSNTLGQHNRLWDRIQLPPPGLLLRRALSRRLQYLNIDDKLLSQHGGASQLSSTELENACEERGLDILGRREALLRGNLSWWLKRQQDDRGCGRAMLAMLFRRLAMRDWLRLNLEANDRSQA